ncbi:uncharacterized protein [Epargyreus clarus]|uniref:uncharacterized protein n=1 Tax=Epargyreus clarus TaxID=520877 RepID=UPI003C2D7838
MNLLSTTSFIVKMATTGVGFRWLDILEKEFDKACVELDTSVSDLDTEDGVLTFGARQKIATLSSCFAQLTHKALTIFQHSAKLEAELVDMRADLVQARATSAGGCQEGGDAAGNVPEAARARAEAAQLARENAALRDTVLALHSDLYGARLATKYLDKELAGRIQQLQLLGRDMRAELRDSLWAQVEAEILLQRHKTLVRVCRGVSPRPPRPPPAPRARPRTVRVRRSPHLGLGISVTGGREHGVPILISELEAGGPAALTGDLYVGDAILAINDLDLTQACHKEAVQALQSVKGDCALCVQFIATDDDDRLSEDNYRFPLYPEDGSALGEEPDGSGATPTAPRTPDYNNRPPSEIGSGSDCDSRYHMVNNVHMPRMTDVTNMVNMSNMANMASLNNMVNMNSMDNMAIAPVARYDYASRDYNNINNNLAILDMDDDSIKIEARLEMSRPEASPRRRGAYRPLAASPPAAAPSSASPHSASPHSTPVHQKRLALKKKRKPQDWRTKGAYRALAPDAPSSDEPLAPPPAAASDEDRDDDVIVVRDTYPAIVSDSLLNSSPQHTKASPPSSSSSPTVNDVPPSPAPTLLLTPAAVPITAALPKPPVPLPTSASLPTPAPLPTSASLPTTASLHTSDSLAPTASLPTSISVLTIASTGVSAPAQSKPELSPSSPTPPPAVATVHVTSLADIDSKSRTNGEAKPLLRRESKGFRIGSARRVGSEGVSGAGGAAAVAETGGAAVGAGGAAVGAGAGGSAAGGRRRARLLPGRGDPDFGTPV